MLTDNELTTALRSAFADATNALSPRDDLVHEVRTQHNRRRRLVIVARITAPTMVLAAALIAMTLHATDPSTPSATPGIGGSSASPAPGHTTAGTTSGDAIRLDGYKVALPSGYALRARGSLDTNCTGQLHLTDGESSRLITTPDPGCPLLIEGVTRVLPRDATRQTIPGESYDGNPAPQSVVWFNAADAGGRTESYFPAKLADGSTVYVSFATGAHLNYQQVIDLADGLHVSPTTPCAGPCG